MKLILKSMSPSHAASDLKMEARFEILMENCIFDEISVDVRRL